MRRLPKPVIAMVNFVIYTYQSLLNCDMGMVRVTFCVASNKVAGYAVGGGHVLHMVCDLTIAADNAIFGQTGPKVSWSNHINTLIFY